jgi:uncharacterized protein
MFVGANSQTPAYSDTGVMVTRTSADRLVYLHGFASGPRSAKVALIADICDRLGLALTTPDLNLPTFGSLSVDAMVDIARYVLLEEHGRTFALGSSLGAAVLLRALAQQPAPNVERVVLLAPVIDHRAALLRIIGPGGEEQWRQAGTFEFQHYAADRRLRVRYDLIDHPPVLDDAELARIDVPVLLLSAADDPVATLEETERLLQVLPNAVSAMVQTDHQFARGFDVIWKVIGNFLGIGRSEPDRLVVEPVTNQELRELAGLVDEAVALIQTAYGDHSYAPAIHRERIVHEGSDLVSIRDIGRLGAPMIAVSYVRHDGKVGAVAVEGAYRGRGLAARMSRALIKIRSPQFMEVERDNDRSERMSLAAGFRPMYDQTSVTRLMAAAGHTVTCLGQDRLGVYYERYRHATGRSEIMRTLTLDQFDEHINADT